MREKIHPLNNSADSPSFLFLRVLRVLRGPLARWIKYKRPLAMALALFLTVPHFAQDRFPRPEFKSDYSIPTLQVPNAPDAVYEYVDLAVLAAAIMVMTALVLKVRSRNAVFVLALFSIVYFGFIRQGCICPVGSIQNVVLALSDPSYAVPLAVVGFFLLPLIGTLLFGRTFCAGVCPLGAIQDLVVLKPIRVPRPVAAVLGLLPFAYLGLAVLFTASGIGFIICRFDPFVEIFRLGSRWEALAGAVVFLGIGVFVARPYCRFLCPYGALLSVLSRFSWKHVVVSPTDCVDCRLCENVCPVDAILPAVPETAGEGKRTHIRRLTISMVLLPILVVVGGLGGKALEGFFLHLSPDAILAETMARERATGVENTTEESRLFRESGVPEEELTARVGRVKEVLGTGSILFGAFMGLVIGLKILGLAVPPTNTSYIPDRAQCLSCARCFKACPQEHVRLKQIKEKRSRT